MNIVGVTLFNSTGVTEVDRLEPLSLSWLDELDAEGSFSLTVTYEQGTNIEIGSIVKFAFGESSTDYVFAGIVSSIKVEKSGESTGGVAKTFIVNGTGVRAMLADAVVYNSGVSNLREYTSQTAGYIFRTLFLEAQARSALTGMSLSFSNTLDSYGDAFTESLTIDVQVGSTMLDLSREHGELAVDVYVSPDLEVSYYNVRGDDLTITANPIVLRVGSNVSELNLDTVGPVKNAILIGSGEQGTDYTTKTNGSSISSYGRKETFLSLASTSDAAQITLSSNKLFLNVAQPSDSVTIQLDLEGSLPYIDFNIGDYVWLADDTGTKTKYRVRAFTFAQDANGTVTIIPELGDVRADLDKRLARLLNRAERGKADAAGAVIGYTPGDLDLGGAPFDTGTIVSYDPITGDGVIDIGGVNFNFTNATGFGLNAGDEIVTTVIEGEHYGIGYTNSATFGSHELTNYIVPSSVAGLPRVPSIDLIRPAYHASNTFSTGQRTYMGSGADYVFYLSGATTLQQTNISAGTTTNYVFPSMTVDGSAYTNGTTAVASNSTTAIYFMTGGVITTVTYASEQIRCGGWDGTYYWFCVTNDTLNTTKAVKVHGTTGVHTVDDITATFPAHDYTYKVIRAGDGYCAIWAGNIITHTAGSTIGMWVYNGTSATIFSGIDATTSINHSCFNRGTSPFYIAAVGMRNSSLSMTDIEGGYMYWTYSSAGATGQPCTGFQKLNLATGTLTLYNNIFPVSLLASSNLSPYGAYIGAMGGGNVVIASSVRKDLLTGPSGSGQMQIFFLTDGTTTTMVQSDGPEGDDTADHAALCSADSTSGIGYVYYSLTSLQDYITGATV